MADKALPSPAMLRQLLHYDPETGELHWRVRGPEYFCQFGDRSAHECAKWNGNWAGKRAFATVHSAGYFAGSIFYRKYLAHRVAFAICHGRWPVFVDHINGNRQDNRIANLREVTRAENQRNQRLNAANTSGHMGVSFNKREQRWVAYIRFDGKMRHLGKFERRDDAVEARKLAERQLGFHANHGRP